MGAAIATILAEFTVCLMQMIFVRKELDLKAYFKQGSGFFVIGAVMYAVVAFACPIIPVNNALLTFIIQVLTGIVVYALLSFVYLKYILKFPIIELLFKKKRKAASVATTADTPRSTEVASEDALEKDILLEESVPENEAMAGRDANKGDSVI